MSIVQSNFIKGRMNKSVDERLLPPGEYVDGQNIRLGSTENTEIGSVENSKGNTLVAELEYDGVLLSTSTKCIGVLEDGSNETIYWFVTDPANPQSATGKVDMIVSLDVINNNLTYHVISTSILNFNSTYLITGVNKIDELLFFTDHLNPPRKINITRAYSAPTALHVDTITEAELNVIVQPPVAAPTINLLNSGEQENFLEENMISLAYRYQYLDNEYSALSQFTKIAFTTGPFNFDTSNFSNTGMENIYNTVQVTFNTGSKLVKAIDLCFKYGNKPEVFVMEKYVKGILGWSNNITRTETFRHNQIYTTLSANQLTRLYDNVPRKAKAQSIMANRLIYGNYVDGYNVTNQIDYSVLLKTEDIELYEPDETLGTGVTYTIDPADANTIADSKVTFDYSVIDDPTILKQDAQVGFEISFISDSFEVAGGGAVPGVPNNSQATVTLTYLITLDQNYNSVYEMFVSDHFQEQFGTVANIQTVADCADGFTFTDFFNCGLDGSHTGGGVTWNKDASGITGTGQPLLVTATPGSSDVSVQLIAMRHVDAVTPGSYMYGYYKFVTAASTFSTTGSRESLHSNRNFEVGIVYMDEYLRSTTALISPNNTLFVPPANSITKNTIEVTIPATMSPPSWATRYKFVVKRAELSYETIYSVLSFEDSEDNSAWIKLEGDNQVKTKVGDTLIVKADVNGALSRLVTTKVLDLESKTVNFLTPAASEATTPYIAEPAGLYMNIKPSGFALSLGDGEDSFFDSGRWKDASGRRSGYPVTSIPCYTTTNDPTSGAEQYTNFAIPEGTIVNFSFRFNRDAKGSKVKSRAYDYERSVTAGADYDTLYQFVIGENIQFDQGVSSGTDTTVNTNVFYPAIASSCPSSTDTENKYQFKTTGGAAPILTADDGTTPGSKLRLCLRGGTEGKKRKRSYVQGRITVNFASETLILETTPLNADNEIFYENEEVFNITGGFHMSGAVAGDQNQTALLPAIVNLSFFDCFTFANGAESYKYLDELDGSSFNLGQKTTSVLEEDYKEANRYASLTYSGIYQEETNINRTNEFNLSDANFKDLEKSFGSIEKLHPFETNLLVLQEDKISNVLLNKDILTAASGGGVVATSAQVLGTQVARIEDYGISNNPESFVSWGADRFFTDVKRGAVLQLKGSGGVSDALKVISETGMRSYFRDEFNTNRQTQKLGGFDPYMNEYALTSTDIPLPDAVTTTSDIAVECGAFFGPYNYDDPITYVVTLGEAQGNVVVDYKITGTVALDWTWGASSGNIPAATGVGSFNFNKTAANPTTMTIVVTPTGSYTMKAIVNCPSTNEITVVQITLGDISDAGLFIHDEYYWNDATTTSPVSSELSSFGELPNPPRVARYESTTGVASEGLFPINGCTITMASNKIDFDTLVFDNAGVDADKFQYHVSNTLYTDSTADINSLLGAASTITGPYSNPSTGYYTGSFTYNNPTNLTYLYLIYNYSAVIPTTLYFGTTALNACCLGVSGTYYLNGSDLASATAVYTDANLTTLATDGFYRQTTQSRQLSGGVLLPQVACVSPCNIIYLSTMRAAAADFCGATVYVMSTAAQTTTNHAYASVTIGDVLDIVPAGGAGYYAYGAVNGADTSAPTWRIMQINGSGEVLSLFYGDPGVCGAVL